MIEMCSSLVPGGVSIMRQSRSSQSTSVKNCLMRPFLRGPLQITGSSLLGNMNPMDITAKLSSTQTGDHPSLLQCTSYFSKLSILGIEGPQISISRSPTLISSSNANERAIYVDIVDFPTPPLPETTRIIFLTFASFLAISSIAGSSSLVAPLAQIV